MIRWRIVYSRQAKCLWVETGSGEQYWSDRETSWTKAKYVKEDIDLLRWLLKELGDVKGSGHQYTKLQKYLEDIIWHKMGERI